ncbi:MAG: hypothetical protein ACUVX8_08260 [Candidatus Zipacnadales bacterium]
MKPLRRVTLETSLKPFKRIDADSIRATCHEVYRQWLPLLERAEGVAVMLWTGDGSEIFEWRGKFDDPLPWALSIGFCNLERGLYPRGWDNFQRRRDYVDNPPVMTYGTLRDIISWFRQVGQDDFGLNITIGATVDPGPEFVESEFKYERHREIFRGGPDTPWGPTVGFICAYCQLNGEAQAYAGFPHGLPDGTSFGTFLGRQFASFSKAMGFDYLWLSNGLGFSHYPWNMVGENFDGQEFGKTDYAAECTRVTSFWRDLHAELPSLPIELRGTNFPLGVDVAADCISFEEIYAACPTIVNPPVNPPWGSRDLGMEIVAQLSRIAVLPAHGTYAVRHYINDPWFFANPWWDYYNREPFDIYCPWVCARLNAAGEVECPQYLELLTIDTERGELNPDTALETIPHIHRAIKMAPDAPGLLTLVYPYREFHALARERPMEVELTYFHDLFLRSAVQSGLPLNTVISTDNLLSVLGSTPDVLNETILVALAPREGWAYTQALCDWVKKGGKALLFGPLAKADPRVQELLAVKLAEPLTGQLRIVKAPVGDIFPPGYTAPEAMVHRPVLSGGPLLETAPAELVRAIVADDSGQRAAAVVRKEAEWNGGGVVWVRGSLPLTFREGSTNPIQDTNVSVLDTSVWLRNLLAEFDCEFTQVRHDAATRCAYVFVSRNDNAFLFTGHKPDATTQVQLRLPQGAPLLTERETRLVDGRAQYGFDRSYQHECRVFVQQTADTLLSCKEMQHPTGTRRRILISGLQDATLTLYPSTEAVEHKTVGLDGPEGLRVTYDQARKCVLVSQVTGNLTVIW